jgi:hypothetical protein
MLIISKDDLVKNLLAYGEKAASERVPTMSAENYQRVCELGFRHALTGMLLLKAGCLAAIEVLEGKPRELKRKRRVWADAESAATELDPILAKVMQRFDEYSGGQQLRKKEICDDLGQRLRPAVPGFEYYRSRRHFRRPFRNGIQLITLEYSHGSLSIRFGVQHGGIEQAKARLFPSGWVGNPFSPTISKWSFNMGPEHYRSWRHSSETTWPISGSEGLERAIPEIMRFLSCVALPYVLAHQEPDKIRDTLLSSPGRYDQGVIFNAVFSIDWLLRRRDWLDEDYQRMRAEIAAPPPAPQIDPASRFALLLHSRPEAAATRQEALQALTRDYEATLANWED